ncbi:hypothetical protein [Jannaschia seohaensis]|uniref:hypothetical protein n=1 Tax=Jannaschia seohaensis TaxID=475081 RepID=UPI000D6C60CC|nr:hypothetical protein [Jannaschia seohaensis]
MSPGHGDGGRRRVPYGSDVISRFGALVRAMGDMNGHGWTGFAFLATDTGNGYGVGDRQTLDRAAQPDEGLLSTIEGDLADARDGGDDEPGG